MLNKITALQFFLHMLFLVSYGYFHFEDIKAEIVGDDQSLIVNHFGKDSLIYDFVRTCW